MRSPAPTFVELASDSCVLVYLASDQRACDESCAVTVRNKFVYTMGIGGWHFNSSPQCLPGMPSTNRLLPRSRRFRIGRRGQENLSRSPFDPPATWEERTAAPAASEGPGSPKRPPPEPRRGPGTGARPGGYAPHSSHIHRVRVARPSRGFTTSVPPVPPSRLAHQAVWAVFSGPGQSHRWGSLRWWSAAARWPFAIWRCR
jgi:hypothetical protein